MPIVTITKTICNRCNQFYEYEQPLYKPGVSFLPDGWKYLQVKREKDGVLCPDCYKKFKSFMDWPRDRQIVGWNAPVERMKVLE